MKATSFFGTLLVVGWAAVGSTLSGAGAEVAGQENATPTRSTAMSMETLDAKTLLGPGDQISYRVLEDRDPAVSLAVTDSGEVEVPYYGRIRAAGRTCRELAQVIKERLEKRLYYRATVLVGINSLSKTRGKVYLVGYVVNPGPQEIPNTEVYTLSKAVLSAGGFREFANPKKVKLVRKRPGDSGEGTTLTVDLTAIWQHGRLDKDVRLEPGDLIYVPGRLINF